MNAIAKAAKPVGVALSPAPDSEPLADSLLNFVARAMTDPTIDVDKLQVLLRLQREIVADDARLQFNRAMSRAQGEMLPVTRDAANDATRSRYARLETIDEAVRPIYVRHGFCLSFNSEPTGGANERIVCEVSHSAGHSKRFQLEAGLDTSGARGNANKTPLHGLGSTVSYLRRYLVCMIFNIVLRSEDSDGNRPRVSQREATGEIGNTAEITELYELLAACAHDPLAVSTNQRGFLDSMGMAAVASIDEAPRSELPRLRNALKTKLSVRTQRAALNKGIAA